MKNPRIEIGGATVVDCHSTVHSTVDYHSDDDDDDGGIFTLAPSPKIVRTSYLPGMTCVHGASYPPGMK